MNIYYVYAYLRNKDSDTAKAGTPYYIGKGTNRRLTEKHSVPIPKDDAYIVIMENNLTEVGALALERRLIRWHGRKDLDTGILLNRTDGGDGGHGSVRSKELVARIAKANTGSKRTLEQRENISKSKTNPSRSTRQKMSMSARNRTMEQNARPSQRCISPSGEEFSSVKAAAEYYDWQPVRIYASMRRGVSGWKYI